MRFTNQFLITKQPCPPSFPGKQIYLADYKLYYHPSLPLAVSENSDLKIVIAGNLYDYQNPKWGNQKIAESLLKENENFEQTLKATYKYSGEFILFFLKKTEGELKVFSDATGQIELFFSILPKGEVVAATSYRLVELTVPLKKDTSVEATEFFNSEAFKNKRTFVGQDTFYENLKRLIANHYLDLKTGETVRFFPKEQKRKTTLKEAAGKSAVMLKGYVEAAANRHKLLIPVTAGWDSRVLLAASKEVTEKSIYYVYHMENNTANYDIEIPQKLFQKLNIPFRVFEQKIPTPEEKEKLIQNAESDILFPNYRVGQRIEEIHKKYPGYLTLNGNISEIIRLHFDDVFFLSPKKIAYIQNYPGLNYALTRYEKWFELNKNEFEKYGYSVLDMLYWEENCSNWVAKFKAEFRAYGFEIFSPFNSRELILTLYGLPKKYRRKQNPVVYKKMIEMLWPDVLQVPVNPGFKKIAMRITQYLGIFPIFRNLKLWWNLFKGRKRW